MVGVGVGDDDRTDRTLAKRGIDRGKRRCGELRRHQRVDKDPACLAANDRHVGIVECPRLPYAVTYLEQTRDGIQTRHPPERRVHRIGRRAVQEFEGVDVPCFPVAGPVDAALGQGGNLATRCGLEILFPVQWQAFTNTLVGTRGRRIQRL